VKSDSEAFTKFVVQEDGDGWYSGGVGGEGTTFRVLVDAFKRNRLSVCGHC
jgi:hypothetical protein